MCASATTRPRVSDPSGWVSEEPIHRLENRSVTACRDDAVEGRQVLRLDDLGSVARPFGEACVDLQAEVPADVTDLRQDTTRPTVTGAGVGD